MIVNKTASLSPALTIGIPSFNRSKQLSELVSSISKAINSTQNFNVEVIVVLDGSTDDSELALDRLIPDYPVTLLYKWQENAGLATTRNNLIKLANSPLVWLLDDDMVVDTEALECHLQWNRDIAPILTGPCNLEGHPGLKAFYSGRWERLKNHSYITNPGDMSFANTSFPVKLLLETPFDQEYKKYGFEDYEVTIRLMKSGVKIGYDVKAGVVHLHEKDVWEMLQNNRDEGVNRVAFANVHPDYAEIALSLQRRKYRPLLIFLTNLRMHRFLWFCANAFMHINRVFKLSATSILVSLSHESAIHSGIAQAGGKMCYETSSSHNN